MDTLYRPFTPERWREVRGALSHGAANLDELVRLRHALSGRRSDLPAVRGLLASEPGFAGRFFGKVVPSLVRHASALVEKAPPSLAVHAQGRASRTALPRAEVAGWLAHMVFGSLPPPSGAPRRDALPKPPPKAQEKPPLKVQGELFPLDVPKTAPPPAKPTKDDATPSYRGSWPRIDFIRLLESDREHEVAKLRCVFEYFERVAATAPAGRFEVERVVLPARTSREWEGDASPLTEFLVDEAGTIEDAHGHLQTDFANAYLGGGVLGRGATQEEIRFAMAPEFMAAMVLSPVMGDEEAIVMRGAERFARTRGYGQELRYAGAFHDPVARTPDGTPDVELTAIDAVDYHHGDPKKQFEEAAMLRELGKARAGFRRDRRGRPVATGNWGCGVFLGDHALKAVLQWLAASAEGRAVRYLTFGDERVGPLADFVERATERFETVGELWWRLRTVAHEGGGPGLYERVLGP